ICGFPSLRRSFKKRVPVRLRSLARSSLRAGFRFVRRGDHAQDEKFRRKFGMNLVVMKFGGTSVEDSAAIRRTAAIEAGRVAKGKSPVVVVSAMAKVTDQLLRAAAAASIGD